jgi:hypothetical protein
MRFAHVRFLRRAAPTHGSPEGKTLPNIFAQHVCCRDANNRHGTVRALCFLIKEHAGVPGVWTCFLTSTKNSHTALMLTSHPAVYKKIIVRGPALLWLLCPPVSHQHCGYLRRATGGRGRLWMVSCYKAHDLFPFPYLTTRQ